MRTLVRLATCATVVLAAVATTAGVSAAKHRAHTVRVLPTHDRAVALTFDCGADTGYARRILRILNREGVRASFGLTGLWARANPGLVRRMAKHGHTLLNHTFDHRSWTAGPDGPGLSASERRRELRHANRVIKRIAGQSTKPYFRPPFGATDADALRLLPRLGYRYNVLWSTDSLGWAGASEDAIVGRVRDGLRRGAIFLFHVGRDSADGLALNRIIRVIRRHGYRFATIAEYLRGSR